MVNKQSSEYEHFDQTMQRLIKVSHSDIKAKLDIERAEKQRKRKAKPSVSGRVSGEKD